MPQHRRTALLAMMLCLTMALGTGAATAQQDQPPDPSPDPEDTTGVRSELAALAAAAGITAGLEAKVTRALDTFDAWYPELNRRGPAMSHLNRAIRLLEWQADVVDSGKPNQGDAAGLRALAGSIRDLAEDLTPQISDGFRLVGHEPLYNRGMNAAIAMHGDYVYVGNRTDGQEDHPHPGILVVDVSNPVDPEVVGEVGPPDAALVAETSRELRVWPQQDLLIVMNFRCSSSIHACANRNVPSRFTFFDIGGENATAPKLVATYQPSQTPHEMYLWVDPDQPEDRALLYWTTVVSSQTQPSLRVTDLSRVRDGEFPEVRWAADFPRRRLPDGSNEDRRLHSIGVSNDGTEVHLSFLGAGYLLLDSSEVAAGLPDAQITYKTPPENRVAWSNPGAHSSVPIFGTDVAFITDEVYGDALGSQHGCPWGWVRTVDISDPENPEVIGEFRAEENEESYCDTPAGQDPANTRYTSFSAHNPTLTNNLAFVTWHSAGFEVLDLTDPADLRRVGKFKPRPLRAVATEDPALSEGLDKVGMWSYPIVSDGLVYVIDVRNGLYVLEYTGPRRGPVSRIDFLEGNSNLGDALDFEPVEPRGSAGPSFGSLSSAASAWPEGETLADLFGDQLATYGIGEMGPRD